MGAHAQRVWIACRMAAEFCSLLPKACVVLLCLTLVTMDVDTAKAEDAEIGELTLTESIAGVGSVDSRLSVTDQYSMQPSGGDRVLHTLQGHKLDSDAIDEGEINAVLREASQSGSLKRHPSENDL